MIQHLCDRCKSVIDPEIGLISPRPDPERKVPVWQEFRDGEKSWRFTVSIMRNHHELCRDCICAVIKGQAYVEPATARNEK